MVIIDFSNTPKQAFKSGFIKGLSAPIMLFGRFNAPNLPKINTISLPTINTEQALSNDWKVIGNDFSNVIARYGKETDTIAKAQ